MSKRGENIYKRKDGRWEGRYVKCRTPQGKIQYGYVYGKSYSEAKAKLKENASTPIRASINQMAQFTLYGEILKAWLLSAKNRVKESTISRYNHIVQRHIQPFLGNYQISEIGAALLEEYIDYLLQHGRLDGSGGLSPKSVADIIVVIKSSMRYAQENGYRINCSTNVKRYVLRQCICFVETSACCKTGAIALAIRQKPRSLGWIPSTVHNSLSVVPNSVSPSIKYTNGSPVATAF